MTIINSGGNVQKIMKFSLIIKTILIYVALTYYYKNKIIILMTILISTYGLVIPMDLMTNGRKILFLSEVDISNKSMIIITVIKIVIYILILPFLFYFFTITAFIARYMSLYVILLIVMSYAAFLKKKSSLALFVLSLCDIYLPFLAWAAICSLINIEEKISDSIFLI